MRKVAKIFNTDGYCDPELHYMVDLSGRLKEISEMVKAEKYFTINKARQYGKTTILTALADYLKYEYHVISLDFQGISHADFQSEQSFAAAFSRQLLDYSDHIPDSVKTELIQYASGCTSTTLSALFATLLKLCKESERKIVLIIDEIDTASNNQVFLDFLAQLRFYYLKRKKRTTFQSVILAGVTDIRSIRRKIRSDEDHKYNSPWNIAADFLVDLSFSRNDIAGMLMQYEADHRTGMDIMEIADFLYSYTAGYPFLVSRICKLTDERIIGMKDFPDRTSAWTKEGLLFAVKMLLEENNPLFDSLMNKLSQYDGLKSVISRLLFQGQNIAYVPDDTAVRDALMFGFVIVRDSIVQIANRLFEMRLYNRFLLDYKEQNSDMYTEASKQKNQLIIDGHLNMRLVLEKFVSTFDYLYGDREESFLEDEGRRYFMLFLRPIINGTGNCYVEAETRNRDRMDLVIDYRGEQSICELKIWHGEAYNKRGEKQLSDYLDYFGLKIGYMLSFNFNKNKKIGVKEIVLGDRLLIEAVV